MKRIKKLLRICLFITLIILACVGIGFAGPVPLTLINKDRHKREKDKTEWVESHREKDDIKKPD